MRYLFVFIVTLNNVIFYSDFILFQYLFPKNINILNTSDGIFKTVVDKYQ